VKLDGPHVSASHGARKGASILRGSHDDGLVVGDGVVRVSKISERAVGNAGQQRVRLARFD